MERRSEIRNIHLKSMLSERCSGPNALLEAMIKQTHRRGQLGPANTTAARCHHYQTPDHLRKTPGSNCTVVALQRAHGIESPTKEEVACINIFLDCRMRRKDRWFVLTNHEWEAVIATSKYELGKPHTSCLLSFKTRGGIAIACASGGRSHLCFRSKAVHHVQIPEVQPSEYCTSTLPVPIRTTLMPLKLRMTLQKHLKNLYIY